MDRQIELNIIKRIQSGQKEGFDKLYSEYYHYVNYICRSIVGSEAISRELTNDAFIKAMVKIKTFNVDHPNSSFKAFIRVIAYNLSINFWKRQNMEKEILRKISEETKEQDTSAEKPIQLLEKNENEKRVRNAFDRLPESSRLLMEEYYMKGCKYSEICEAYQITKGHLDWEIRKGLEWLRKELLDLKTT